ncbi:acyltransferase family protein [Atlantibacter hermannii]|uniref:acyltransferase family protein n=1 Tax=Atlantibacter hermannii TaxID=565 RepID=UPI0028AE0560|nr:acyltransferase [Atlantibacter hermannii]
MKQNRVEFANILRGLACLIVVFYHYTVVFWDRREAVSALTNSPVLNPDLYAYPTYLKWAAFGGAVDLGAIGVAIFFLISGFVIPFSLHGTSAREFLKKRALRIFPVYAVGFTLTLLMIGFSSVYYNAKLPFTTLEALIHYIPGIRDILDSKPIDGVVWTLEVEVKFYLAFALVKILFKDIPTGAFFMLVIIFLIGLTVNILSIKGYDIPVYLRFIHLRAQYIVYMFIGFVFYLLYSKKITMPSATVFITAITTMFSILMVFNPFSVFKSLQIDYYIALFIFAGFYIFKEKVKDNRLFSFFASISYPLYVIHGVNGYIMMRILIGAGVKAWVSLLLTFFVAVLVSYILHITVEKRYQSTKKSLRVTSDIVTGK